jgi:flagellar basal body rod protein FlgB
MTIIDGSIEQGHSRITTTVNKFHDENTVDFQYEVMKLIKSTT